ncbi:SEC-C motif-containing protein [Fibrobacter sp. UWH9]|uniref:SEC-C metal-binding domain-containing protein n=1 Tax=Fibrobacter sp. UWH9 TaxID=1896213 RepID=UPI00091C7E9D|nr:SEC-C metal-binding domain-containing protein [Fibrobacter sp. UWH9]SHH83303.1 SEC-C motif-containing protein [Fibrobacter sp. UWH9]
MEKLLEKSKTKKKVIFIDEMPWIDTPKSKFISALENFWNGWANLRDDIYLIATGSATSWKAEKLFSNQGGLYNRITQQIYLSPFTLGGVPYYLSLLDGQKSLAQNIDSLFFEKNARLQNEFEELYTTLFNDAEKYISIVELLAQNKKGVTREFIAEKIHLTGGILTKYLNNLERCDFIQSFTPFGRKKKGSIFKLVDFYTLFHLKFIKGYSKRNHKFWTHSLNTPGINSWQGLAFELVCLQHIDQINEVERVLRPLQEFNNNCRMWTNLGHTPLSLPRPGSKANPFGLANGIPFQNSGPKVGRNDPCPCGSGLKFKKCCGKNMN